MMERVILGSIGKAVRLATDHSCLIITPTSNSFERINNKIFLGNFLHTGTIMGVELDGIKRRFIEVRVV